MIKAEKSNPGRKIKLSGQSSWFHWWCWCPSISRTIPQCPTRPGLGSTTENLHLLPSPMELTPCNRTDFAASRNSESFSHSWSREKELLAAFVSFFLLHSRRNGWLKNIKDEKKMNKSRLPTPSPNVLHTVQVSEQYLALIYCMYEGVPSLRPQQELCGDCFSSKRLEPNRFISSKW